MKAQENLLKNLLASQPEMFKNILENQQKYEIQILYTQINRDKNNRAKFKTYSYEANNNHYFYPASTVKLPACLLALEKLNKLIINDLNMNTAMLTKVENASQTEVKTDTTAENGLPSIAHYIKKILLVSDNDAYNRLYEFVGQKQFNKSLWQKGFINTRILHRLETSMTPIENKHTNPIDFYSGHNLVYAQSGQINDLDFSSKDTIKRGIGYLGSDGQLIKQPLDFTAKNKFALSDQHNLLKSLFFPAEVKKKQRFNLSKNDYKFIYQYMSKKPTDSNFPKYSKPDYWPTYCKFLYFGSEKNANWPDSIKVFNKVGDAYGFLIDNAYIVDYEKGIEFLLSAVIHCNEDQIYNDDHYEYDSIGLPFMKNLGHLIYDFEEKRPKKFRPSFENLKN